jgi:tRNA(Ile)-lysidine synthase
VVGTGQVLGRLPRTLERERLSRHRDLLDRCSFVEGAELAVSGGPDSVGMALLAWLCGISFRIHHVDHGLRPESKAEAAFVAALARLLGVPCVVHEVRVGPTRGVGLEAAAREARLGALPANAAFAHTMDDRAETVLLNICRGAGLRGAAVLRPSPRHPVVRLRRRELASVCESAGIEPLTDPSNADPRITRNRVRSHLVPFLNEVLGRDVVPAICRFSDLAAEEEEALEALTPRPRSLRDLAEIPRVLCRRAVARLLQGEGEYRRSLAEVERVMDVIDGKAPATELEGGVRVEMRREGLCVDGKLLLPK